MEPNTYEMDDEGFDAGEDAPLGELELESPVIESSAEQRPNHDDWVRQAH